MELKLDSVVDLLNEQEWFQQVKAKWDELDPQSRLYLKVAGLVAGVLLFLYLILSSLWGVHSLKRDLAAKTELLSMIDNANEEIRRLRESGATALTSDIGATSWSDYFDSTATASSIDKGIMTVSSSKPGTGGDVAKEELFDLSLKKANIRQVIKLAYNLENGMRPVKVRSISIDTGADPSGFLDATLSVSAFTSTAPKGGSR
jgi:type II secretory pathway component PulM